MLERHLPNHGTVLEIASGTGEHAVFFAERFPDLVWQPSEPDREAVRWIDRRRERAALANLRVPVQLNAETDGWPISAADALLCINMVHISPWEATQGLIRGAARLLGIGAPMFLYGPYRRRDVPTAASNEAFDRSLRSRDRAWGLRNVEDVADEAHSHGFNLDQLVEMPANNLTLVFRRR